MKNASEYLANISKLLFGTASAQALTIATTVFAARLYSPKNFAEYGIYIATISLLLTCATARLELALIQVSSLAEYKKILNTSVLVLLIAALVFIGFTTQVYDFRLTDDLVLLIFLGLIAHGLNLVYSNLLSSQQRYSEIGMLRISGACVFSVCSIGFGYYGYVEVGLIVASLLSQWVTAIMYVFLGRVPLALIPIADVKSTLLDYQDYWSIATVSSLLNTLGRQLPVIVLPIIFSPVVAGYYFFSQRIIAAPANLIANSVGNVFRKSATNEYVEFGNFQSIFLFTLSRLAFLVIGGVVVTLSLVDEGSISYVFGADWSGMVSVMQMLIVLYAFKLVISPLTYSLYVVRKIHWNLYAQMLYMLCMLGPLGIGWYFGLAPNSTIALHCVGGCVAYCFYLVISYHCAKNGRDL